MTLTHHGHHIQGTSRADEPEVAKYTDCAGPGECQPCTRDSEKAWYPEMVAKRKEAEEKPLGREDINIDKLDMRGLAKKPRKSNAVVHPSHYNMYDGIEIIDLAEQMTFNEGNAVKYIARGPFKGKHIEDLEKARYYLKKEIKRLKRIEKKKPKARRGGIITGPVIIDEIHNMGPGLGGPNDGAIHMEAIRRMTNQSVTNVYNNG